MKIFKRKILMGTVFLSAFLPFSVFADIALGPDFQGTLVVTSASGEVNLINPGEPLPNVSSDSVIEVLNGSFTVATGEGESISLTCHNQTAVVSKGASASLVCSSESGLLKILKGSVTLIDETNKEIVLPEGTEHPIGPAKKKDAPPTGAGEPEGSSPAGGDLAQITPVDSRSLQSSPSQ
ncbi:MAG: hypothetical protein HYZ83_02470 [Candidatus Omnitrophica bacterium]|nr:hypothetical protein [Candidatus Omnitrophota bacterium]